jgi:hypothetical protein
LRCFSDATTHFFISFIGNIRLLTCTTFNTDLKAELNDFFGNFRCRCDTLFARMDFFRYEKLARFYRQDKPSKP